MDPKIFYEKLFAEFGDLDWWPMDHLYHKENNSDPRFEVIIGAILTQNTSWSNVEKTIDKLKRNRVLDIDSLASLDEVKLKDLIRSSGFFNQKANRLKNICKIFKNRYDSNLDLFFDNKISKIRTELLKINGIGPETADSIILYAGGKPIFVVDAYTKRVCKRIPFPVENSYEDIQKYFQSNLKQYYKGKKLTEVYNQLHALIVELAKNYCKTKPICNNCPLKKDCSFSK